MALRLDGKALAKTLELRLQSQVRSASPSAGRPPGLAVLRVGDDPASAVYVANKEKACARIGVESYGSHLPADATSEQVLEAIRALNAAPATPPPGPRAGCLGPAPAAPPYFFSPFVRCDATTGPARERKSRDATGV